LVVVDSAAADVGMADDVAVGEDGDSGNPASLRRRALALTTAFEILPNRLDRSSSLSSAIFGSKSRRRRRVDLVLSFSRTLRFDDRVPTSHHVCGPATPRSDCVSGGYSVELRRYTHTHAKSSELGNLHKFHCNFEIDNSIGGDTR